MSSESWISTSELLGHKKQCVEGECFTWELLGRMVYYSHHPKLFLFTLFKSVSSPLSGKQAHDDESSVF
jgi:hypothetical protein